MKHLLWQSSLALVGLSGFSSLGKTNAQAFSFIDDFNSQPLLTPGTALTHWDVLDGNVDTIGAGTPWTSLTCPDYPAPGDRCIDLDGCYTSGQTILRSKQSFPFANNMFCTFSVDIDGGTHQAEDSVTFSTGGWSETVARTAEGSGREWVHYSWDFTPSDLMEDKITITHHTTGDCRGLYMDNPSLVCEPGAEARACESGWGCHQAHMQLYDANSDGDATDGLEFLHHTWNKDVVRNAASADIMFQDGGISEGLVALDFVKHKADFWVGVNPACNDRKVAQATTDPASVMYHGTGWIYQNGSQKVRIDINQIYPETGDVVQIICDQSPGIVDGEGNPAGTITFSLQKGGVGPFQPITSETVYIPKGDYYLAGSIKHTNAKLAIVCPNEQ